MSNILASGADVLTVHGRTRHQSSSGHPVNLAAINFARSCAKGQVPVIANGDVFDMADAARTRKETGAEGVMSARGLLANPVRHIPVFPRRQTALFASPLTVRLLGTLGTLLRLHPDSTRSHLRACSFRGPSSLAKVSNRTSRATSLLYILPSLNPYCSPSFTATWPTCSNRDS